MRQIFILTWSRMTGVAFQRRSRPACTGRSARQSAGRSGGAAASTLCSASTYPAKPRCLCLVEATGLDLVRKVNDIAQFPLAPRHRRGLHGAGREQPTS